VKIGLILDWFCVNVEQANLPAKIVLILRFCVNVEQANLPAKIVLILN
jgi:hypothetical protein